MSECVVRMEMPQGCWCCPFGHYVWIWSEDKKEKMPVCFCDIDKKSDEDGHYILQEKIERPSWCPIICSLPEGHGRLVDADDVNNHIMGYVDLRDCPTIVPAERRANDEAD